MYLSSKYKHRLKDELDNGDCSVLVVWLICQLLSELCIGFFKPTNLVFKGCHVLTNGGVNSPQVLPCWFLQFFVDVHRFRTTTTHIFTNFGFSWSCSHSPAGEYWQMKPEKASLTSRGANTTEGGNDQKWSWPASHNSCQERWGDEFSARKQVVKMAPVVRPTPIKISAVSAWWWVNGRSSINRRLAIERILLLTFCT